MPDLETVELSLDDGPVPPVDGGLPGGLLDVGLGVAGSVAGQQTGHDQPPDNNSLGPLHCTALHGTKQSF